MAGHLRLGLTGGIGSGKSTVAKMLAQRGAAVIDADAISRSMTAAGGAAITPIAAAFGADFITAAGALDRDRMRNLVFADAAARQRLEAIVHPLIERVVEQQSAAAIDAGHACIVFDVPLLVESGRWRKKLDRVLVVDCPEHVQIERVTTRDGLDREAVEKILSTQATRAARLHAADIVLFNDQLNLAQLAHAVKQVATRFGLSSE